MKRKILFITVLALALAMCSVVLAEDYVNNADVKITLIVPESQPEGIELWPGELDQTIYTHAGEGVEPEDCIGELHIYVYTTKETPWTVTARSDGFVDSKGKSCFFEAWFLQSEVGGLPDNDSGIGQYNGNVLLQGGDVTIYTPDPSEYRTYHHKSVTVTPDDGGDPADVFIDKVKIVGGFAVKDGEIVAASPPDGYPANITLTLVR
ncbi:MAG: hypothetical protein JW800_04990 [Candidatus Omnitrophica bacterium]|nr:hypothetical protein [Candidatus Omnitrophota bacterium]